VTAAASRYALILCPTYRKPIKHKPKGTIFMNHAQHENWVCYEEEDTYFKT
jgi:hypothetical protein